MKKRNFMILGVLLLSLLTGCTNNTTEERKEETKTEVKGNCEVKECISQIEVTNTVEEINEIIGFEGEKSDYSDKYTWKLSDKTSIVLDNSSTSAILQATIDKNDIMSEDVSFSNFNEIKEELNKGTKITYEEMVEKLGGVEGTLAGKTSTSNRYIWVDKHERTFSATFKNTEDGYCSIISLR